MNHLQDIIKKGQESFDKEFNNEKGTLWKDGFDKTQYVSCVEEVKSWHKEQQIVLLEGVIELADKIDRKKFLGKPFISQIKADIQEQIEEIKKI